MLTLMLSLKLEVLLLVTDAMNDIVTEDDTLDGMDQLALEDHESLPELVTLWLPVSLAITAGDDDSRTLSLRLADSVK
jgi:hypothetical protein